MEDELMAISWPVKMIDNYQFNFLTLTHRYLPTKKMDGYQL
jgi:hypothetical protein